MRVVFEFMLFEAGAFFGFFVAALLNAARSLSSRICCNVIPRIFRYHSWLQIRKVVSAWNVEKPC